MLAIRDEAGDSFPGLFPGFRWVPPLDRPSTANPSPRRRAHASRCDPATFRVRRIRLFVIDASARPGPPSAYRQEALTMDDLEAVAAAGQHSASLQEVAP